MNHDQIRLQIKNHYEKNEIHEVIERTVFLFKMTLQLGYSSHELYTRTHDLGVKPPEMGISLAIALKQTDNGHLNDKDLIIKEKLLKEKDMAKAISTWEKGLVN